MSVDGRPDLTRMLVRVRDAAEAVRADLAGVDMVETDLVALPAVRAKFRRGLRLDIEDCGLTPDVVRTALEHGVDELSAGLASDVCAFPETGQPTGLAVVARLPASVDLPGVLHALPGHIQGITIEPEPGRSLFDGQDLTRYDAITATCRTAGLGCGFGGGLEAPDVARLLLLRPDVLGFDAAVRRGPSPGALDPHALETMRALIPRRGKRSPEIGANASTDRIFVREFVLPVSIGAYSSERQTTAARPLRCGRGDRAPRCPAPRHARRLLLRHHRRNTAHAGSARPCRFRRKPCGTGRDGALRA